MSLRVVVLASGAGTNLQAILDELHGGPEGVVVVGVAGDRPGAPALERAAAAGVATAVFPRDAFPDRAARDAALAAQVQAWEADLVVLAGYMALLDPGFTRRFAGRIVNVHPSLLPVFPGLRAIEQAIAYGVKVAGVTVHLVDDGIDTGAILLQDAVAVADDETAASLHDRLRPLEHALLCRAVRAFAAGGVSVDPDNPRRMRVT
ncbi:phosphoribosylglycinamide formyltransferase [Conexibacter sp. W3-3-2]|uniref:phosphoribosylglycinamide formyltransferase n=1 Tax=Conexibacter sp. W3-3-2 TaxID=2675227 RepID=UPI0012B771AE|nr:phosphoribosylglycinamide formyltransferase [Conexibacter sp. W3-3-2]MTD45224.1 phosphoribosylglycinamide formyltransferase [Conexibacter sp. W3-3-2]